MSTNTVLLSNFTNCSAIAYSNLDISQVWYGSTLVWSGTSGYVPPIETSAWVAFPSGQTVAAAYTPLTNEYAISASMVIDSTQGYNFLNGIWQLTGDVGTKVEVYTSSNNAPVNIGTVDGKTAWLYSFKFSGSTMLSAGTTYLFHINHNYFDCAYLNGNYMPFWSYNWSFSEVQNQTAQLTSASIATCGIYFALTTSGA